ncbi:MAG: UpxY family transcription antiterminator [Bacteroidales bacterium]|nr:UpxY family transcription antiterminator [Bacteroidales bacterium]
MVSGVLQNVCWFAARTRYGQEIPIRDRLERLGVEHFIPTRQAGRPRGRRTVERPVINNLIFLRTTKNEACALANEAGVPVRYIIDCMTRTLLVVPDKQMDDFRRVLDLSIDEGGLMDEPLALGERVRVVKGPLKGVEGFVAEFHGKAYVVVSLCNSIFARAQVPRSWLERA